MVSSRTAGEAAPDGGRKTVAKAIRILQAFTQAEPELAVGEIARRVDLHKSVVSRLVATLREGELLEQDGATRRVRLGAGVYRLGLLYANRQPLQRLARPLLARLVLETGHSAHVSVLDGTGMLVVASVESPRPVRVIIRLGDRRPLHTTAAGKVLLSFSPPDVVARVLAEAGLPASTPMSISDPAGLDACLARVRGDGVGWNDGESMVGAGAVAAPVFEPGGAIVAAVSAVYPLGTVAATERFAVATKVKAAAAELTAALGGDGPEQPVCPGCLQTGAEDPNI